MEAPPTTIRTDHCKVNVDSSVGAACNQRCNFALHVSALYETLNCHCTLPLADWVVARHVGEMLVKEWSGSVSMLLDR